MNEEVGTEIAKRFEQFDKVPTLAFIDPWGYKGLTLRLVNAFLKDWGCDCIFFFNYARINAGLNNDAVRTHMDALFGVERANSLRVELEGLTPAAREATIVNALAAAFQSYGNRYVLPFCFKNVRGTRTTHHLILVTKHFKGYDVMKGIMHDTSSTLSQGVASFTFSPPDTLRQGLLFELNRPLDDLREMLCKELAGQSMTAIQLYERHSVNRPYLARHYKQILKEMEESGTIQVSGRKVSSTGKILMKGFADSLLVKFPPLS